MDSEPPIPYGMACEHHDERPAIATCPSCGEHACVECWHQAVDACHYCVVQKPESLILAPAWERGGNFIFNFGQTIADAFRPSRSALSMHGNRLGPAIFFFLLTALPLALLSGVIPFTHYLQFGRFFSVEVLHSASTSVLQQDVLLAAALGLVLNGLQWIAMMLPFGTIAAAFSVSPEYPAISGADLPDERHPNAFRILVRAALYRAWLLPLAGRHGLFFGLLLWATPETMPSSILLVFTMVTVVPLLLWFIHLRASARMTLNAGVLASFLAIVVAFVMSVLVEDFTLSLLEPWLPEAVNAGVEVTQD